MEIEIEIVKDSGRIVVRTLVEINDIEYSRGTNITGMLEDSRSHTATGLEVLESVKRHLGEIQEEVLKSINRNIKVKEI